MYRTVAIPSEIQTLIQKVIQTKRSNLSSKIGASLEISKLNQLAWFYRIFFLFKERGNFFILWREREKKKFSFSRPLVDVDLRN